MKQLRPVDGVATMVAGCIPLGILGPVPSWVTMSGAGIIVVGLVMTVIALLNKKSTTAVTEEQ